jgi:hypothetical protein
MKFISGVTDWLNFKLKCHYYFCYSQKTLTHARTHSHTHTRARARTHILTHTNTHSHTHTLTHTHTRTHSHTQTQNKTRTFYSKAGRWWKQFDDHMLLVHSTGRGFERQKLHTVDAKGQHGCDAATRNFTSHRENNETGFTIGYCAFLD